MCRQASLLKDPTRRTPLLFAIFSPSGARGGVHRASTALRPNHAFLRFA